MNKRAAALALAVAAAAPVVTLLPSRALALSEMDQAMMLLAEQSKPTDAQLLATGMDQFAKGQYEDAQATLQQVKADALPAGDQAKLTDTMQKVESALSQRKAARAEYDLGEQSLKDKNNTEAMRHFRAAADNRFADATTQGKAAQQLQAAEAGMAAAKQDLKNLYKQAVAEEKAGKLTDAREKFVKLAGANYKVGLFEKSPQNFIRDIDRQIADAKAAELAKAQEARKAELAKAEQAAQAEAAAKAAQASAAAAAANPPATQPAAVATAQPAQPGQPAQPIQPAARTAKQAYNEGQAAFKKGDLKLAQADFEEAQAGGYKAGLFEDSPAQYLRRIDQRNKAQAAVASGAAVAEATTPAPAPTVAPATLPSMSPEQRDLQETARLEKARLQQRQYEAQQLVERAAQAQRENRLGDAYYMYAQAADLDPSNRAAVEGKAATQLVTTGATPQSLIDSQINRTRIQKQIIAYSFSQALDNAQKAIAEGRFADAQREIDAAVVAKESNPSLFNPTELNQFDSSLSLARVTLAKAQEATTAQQREQAAAQAQNDAAARALEQQRETRRTVQALARTAQQRIYEGQYSQALGIINQILAIDPANDYAVGVKTLVQDYAIIQQQRQSREKANQELFQTLNAAEDELIPYLDIMNYPVNWPDISEKRDRYVLEERTGNVVSEDQQTLSLLDRRLPVIDFEGAPLADAVEFLRTVSGANIWVDWRKLEAAGVDRTIQVTAKLHDVKLSTALKKILGDVSAGQVKLGYAVDEGILTVSTADELNRNTSTQVYDIRDLLVTAPDFADSDMSWRHSSGHGAGSTAAPQGAGSSQMGGSWTGSNGGSGGPGAFGGAGLSGAAVSAVAAPPAAKELKTEQLVEEISSIIKENVDRNSWGDNGGSGSLRYLTGQLIVTQTPENQRKVGSLLEKLRMTKAIQVCVETRFLTVARNFMEDVGVDLDFYFNINEPGHFTPIPVLQNSSDFTANPQTSVPGSIGTSATNKPAMNIQGSYLDDFQVNFLLRATQASRLTSVVNSPRVTVFNGQMAMLSVGRQTSYVAGYNVVTGGASAYPVPQPSTIMSGVQLFVTPTVSADRKYVTLTLMPYLSNLVRLDNFPTVTYLPPTGFQGAGQFLTNYIQLPIFDETNVSTIVSVPDGGTLLLGGQTIAGETELEEGVPVLSKIPFLKRLFTNKSSAKDETVLLILVKPTILIHREIEQQSFPMMQAR